MKKILLFATLFFFAEANAQVSEGTIKYRLELSGNNNGLGGATMESTLYFKKERSLMEMTTPFYNMKTLSDAKGTLILTEIAGKKTAIRTTSAEMEEARKKNKQPKIDLTKEKKNILGYECTKAIVTLENGKGTQNRMTIWVTTKIVNSAATLGGFTAEMAAKLKGTALEVDIEAGPVSTVLRAVSISLKPVPESVFNPSTVGYTERRR